MPFNQGGLSPLLLAFSLYHRPEAKSLSPTNLLFIQRVFSEGFWIDRNNPTTWMPALPPYFGSLDHGLSHYLPL